MLKTKSAIVLLFVLPIVVGCGPRRPATAPVSGRVTFNGKPLTTGQVMFYPDRGRTSVSPIDADGRYRLTTFKPGDGALLGHHRVTIEAARVAMQGKMPKNVEEEMRGHGFSPGATTVERLAPERYSELETTPLTADVAPQENTINFDLSK
jgi:hypothetical protein